MASTLDDIREVYAQEIEEKSRLVEKKFGLLSFYGNGSGMRTFHLLDTDPCQTRVKSASKTRKKEQLC